MKYSIEVNENQLNVIQKALDFYSRFLSGQWRIPDELQFSEKKLQEGSWGNIRRASDFLDRAKSMLFNKPVNWSYGIGSPQLHEDAKVAYDIYRPILEEFNKDSDSMNVYSSPGMSYSKDGRVTPKLIEDEPGTIS